jgi:oligoendopeptidase F
LRLLDASLSDALAYLVNIPARFELEKRLYELRAEGPLDAEQLEAETTAIYARWYGAGVTETDPLFWANKLHFYIGGLAFYNFPYLFGYLFSALVYEHFRPMGPAGAPGYERLLRRTGDAWAEPIALEELGLDLADPATWALALRSVERDVVAFEAAVDDEPTRPGRTGTAGARRPLPGSDAAK